MPRKIQIINNMVLHRLRLGGCLRTDDIMTMDLEATEIYRRFEHLSIVGQVPTSAEWAQMEATLYEACPDFRDFMREHRLLLNDKEHNTCLLVRLGFRPIAISHMLGTSAAYISMVRSEMMLKLFGLSGPSVEFDKRIQGIG